MISNVAITWFGDKFIFSDDEYEYVLENIDNYKKVIFHHKRIK